MARRALPEVVKIRRQIMELSSDELDELQRDIQLIVEIREIDSVKNAALDRAVLGEDQ